MPNDLLVWKSAYTSVYFFLIRLRTVVVFGGRATGRSHNLMPPYYRLVILFTRNDLFGGQLNRARVYDHSFTI
jgi:hypothetical protein